MRRPLIHAMLELMFGTTSGHRRGRGARQESHPGATDRLPGRSGSEVSREAAELLWQGSLFGGEVPRPTGFATVTRHHLDHTSWVDHVPGFVAGADRLFEEFLHGVTWEQHQRPMYDQIVWEPRLSAGLDPADAGDAEQHLAAAVSGHYGADFDRMWLNLYRDGNDSVAWHGDRIGRTVPEPMVAIVSLGATRTFALRPRAGGVARRLRPASGDLLVMGGRCQHDWEHSVPKTAEPVGPRISFTLRHSEPGRWAR